MLRAMGKLDLKHIKLSSSPNTALLQLKCIKKRETCHFISQVMQGVLTQLTVQLEQCWSDSALGSK